MPRGLIIGVLVVLILGVLGGTVVLITQRVGEDGGVVTSAVPEAALGEGGLPVAQRTNEVANPVGDDDGDGLINADEALWGTDRNNPDSDGDGVPDGQEVRENRNPTIARPNDVLPPGFTPGQDLKPLSAAPPAIDNFFASNIDLTGGNQDDTAAYRRDNPGADEQHVDSLLNYLRAQAVVTQLPEPAADSITLSQATSGVAVQEYLSIAGDLTPFSNKALLSQALDDMFERGDSTGLEGMAYVLRLRQDRLSQTSVPVAAQSLHKLQLGYSELLAAIFDQIAQYNEDPVKSLLGVRRLEEVDERYYPVMVQEVARLQSLSGV